MLLTLLPKYLLNIFVLILYERKYDCVLAESLAVLTQVSRRLNMDVTDVGQFWGNYNSVMKHDFYNSFFLPYQQCTSF